MAKLFDGLLVSAPNGGGLFLIRNGRAIRIDNRNTTGIFEHNGCFLRAHQPDSLVIFGEQTTEVIGQRALFNDIHDVLLYGDNIYLVGTAGNEIIKFDKHGVELKRWVFSGEEDSKHINCLALWNSRLVFSAFGDFHKERQYKGRTKGAGYVQDLSSERKLIVGLSQPHSPTPIGRNLLLANSEEGELREYGPKGNVIRIQKMGGYTRGICVAGDLIYVGLSRSRDVEYESVDSAVIVALDRKSWKELGRLSLPVNEIYSFVWVEQAERLLDILARVSGFSSLKNDERVASLDQSIAARNSEIVALKQALDERDAQLTESREAMEGQDLRLAEISATVSERERCIDTLNQALAACDREIMALNQAIAERDQQVAELEQVAETQEARISKINARAFEMAERIGISSQAIAEREQQIRELRQIAETQEARISAINEALAERDERIGALTQAIASRDNQVAALTQAVAERDREMARIIVSRSWRLTRPLRFIGRVVRGEYGAAVASLAESIKAVTLTQACGAVRYLLRGDIQGLNKRIQLHKQYFATSHVCITSRSSDALTWGIIATPHTLFVAHLLAEHLCKKNWVVEVTTEVPSTFDRDWYIVICPQMFSKLPPGEKRIVFQMEQSVTSRWFTQQYLQILENSAAVLEYALVNIEFMAKMGIAYPHVHYLPIGASETYGEGDHLEKSWDVLFYGDSKSCQRRRSMLDSLRRHFDVYVVSEVFGRDIVQTIRRARLVINLHYYENALLEVPRIQECLSLGVPVVSESAQDQNDYPELVGAVRFFQEGSTAAMIDAVRAELENGVSKEGIAKSIALGTERFSFMFDRFLVAMGFLPASHVRHMRPPLPRSADRIVLSLPETITRRRVLQTQGTIANYVVFDGIRHQPAWVGCALSFQSLARHALAERKSSLLVMEDDALLPPDFEEKIEIVNEFLAARRGNWDIFAGIIAALHIDTQVLSVETYRELTFVTIDKMTSMVCNIYSERAMRLLVLWDPEDRDAERNTIDRYLECQKDLRVIVTLPFLVGHREEVQSTLWGFRNTQYSDMIAASEQALRSKVRVWQQSSQRVSGL